MEKANGYMLRWIKRQIKVILFSYVKHKCKCEFEELPVRFNERPVEYSFVFRQLARIYPKKILDVGTGMSSLPHLMRLCGMHVTATDNIKDYWQGGLLNRHFFIIHDNITKSELREKFDLVTCVSVLEHIEKYEEAVANMFHLLKPNGYLILTFPYTERQYVKNVYELPSSSYGQHAPYICQSYSREKLDGWMKKYHGEIIEQEFWQFWDGDFWTIGKQIIPPRQVFSGEKHQISCLLVRKVL